MIPEFPRFRVNIRIVDTQFPLHTSVDCNDFADADDVIGLLNAALTWIEERPDDNRSG